MGEYCKIECKYCKGKKVIKKGLRTVKEGKKQIYLCCDCCKRFSAGLSKKHFDVKVILGALSAYNNGLSFSEVSEIIKGRYKIAVSKSSVERWIKEYDLGYLKIRERICRKYGRGLISSRMFKHSGQIYNFKFHIGKLNEFGKFSGLKDFIVGVSKGIDSNLFDSNRCSQIKNDVSVNVKISESRLNSKVGEILKLVSHNNKRHSVVEEYLLCCDRDTVAVEVPVWYWDKRMNGGICGHVDVLQVKFGKIWVMDFKPNAATENVDSVVSQLWNYARALSFRSGIGLKDIMCGWFDWNDLYSFKADEVRMK